MGTEAFVGWRGHGKTMLGVDRARQLAALRGVPLISNIWIDGAPVARSRWRWQGGRFVRTVPERLRVERIPGGRAEQGKGRCPIDVDWLVDRLYECLDRGEGAVVFLDEAGVIFNSREWASFDSELGYLFAQGRHLRCDLVITSQFVDQVDKLLRELCEVAHKVRSWPAPTILGRETGRRPLVHVVSTYRPKSVDDPEKRLGRKWMRYRKSREVVYNTDEMVIPPRRLRSRINSSSRVNSASRAGGWSDIGPAPVSEKSGAPQIS